MAQISPNSHSKERLNKIKAHIFQEIQLFKVILFFKRGYFTELKEKGKLENGKSDIIDYQKPENAYHVPQEKVLLQVPQT